MIGETDPLSQALTFALGPVMFGLLGRWLGGLLGVAMLGLVVGVLLGVVGGAATLYYRYQARMETLDGVKPWHRSRPDTDRTPTPRDDFSIFVPSDIAATEAAS